MSKDHMADDVRRVLVEKLPALIRQVAVLRRTVEAVGDASWEASNTVRALKVAEECLELSRPSEEKL